MDSNTAPKLNLNLDPTGPLRSYEQLLLEFLVHQVNGVLN